METLLITDFNINQQDLKVFIPVVGGLIGFIIFWFTWQSENLNQKLLKKYGEKWGPANLVIFTKLFGGFSMETKPQMFRFTQRRK